MQRPTFLLFDLIFRFSFCTLGNNNDAQGNAHIRPSAYSGTIASELKQSNMKPFVILSTALFFATQLNAQIGLNKRSSAAIDETVDILILQHNESCGETESYIYEVRNGKRQRIAYLYPESDRPGAASNFYNLNMISEVITDFNNQGFAIESSSSENTESDCGKAITYRLVRPAQYMVSN